MPGYTAEEIGDWCRNTETDSGFQILNDHEIVSEILNENRNSSDEEEEVGDQVQDSGPSYMETCNSLDIAMNCLERQNDVDPDQLIYLKRIRDMTAQKKSMFFETKVFAGYLLQWKIKINVVKSVIGKKIIKKPKYDKNDSN
uniref:Jerky protein-like protein n=1 Tax=Parasteatoda tepidariorum TaxID=114398 RepID=A0A2L2YCZ3_PARTP